jgi:hypothetical protein
LKLTPDGAEGLIGGYTDVDTYYYNLNKSWATHHLSYGKGYSPALYKALHRLADGYPDPKTGENTAISSAMKVRFSQVFIVHPGQNGVDKTVSERSGGSGVAHEAGR